MNKNKQLYFILAIVFLSSACVGQTQTSGQDYEVRTSCFGVDRCHESIQAALEAIEVSASTGQSRIHVAAGEYFEKVVVRSDEVQILGVGPATTRLYFDAVAQDSGKYRRDNWGTPGSATLTIDADRVTVKGMTIENTFDYLSNDALPDDDPRKLVHSQAVALLLDIHSDRVHLDNVALIGYQDTLFANGKRAYISNSFISGNVDFIFGNGQLLIEDSIIESRRRGQPFAPGEIQSFIAAPSTQLAHETGIVFHRSRLTREDGVPDQSVTLGRPWHPTTNFADGRYADPDAVGQLSYIDCFMDAHIHEQHWSSMHGTARDGTKTDVFRPQDSRFYEAGSYGPGARHLDIGIGWNDALAIEEVYELMFSGWPEIATRLAN